MKKNKEYFLYFLLFFLSLFSIFLIFFPKNYQELRKGASFLTNVYTITNSNTENFEAQKDEIVNNQENQIINFLFLGIAGEGSRGSYLTDSILIFSLNKNKRKIFLISLPRDLLVQAPDKDFSIKINALFELENQRKKGYQNKTFEYITKKINQITGLEISETIVLDLEA
ncbi:MAG: LCP family protein, partial [Minisyncoccia bacterium]